MLNTSISTAISIAISEATDERFQADKIQSVSGGDINQTYQITDNQTHRSYFLKLNRSDRHTMFQAEAAGLFDIANTQAIRVPNPICQGIHKIDSYLVLEYLPLVSLNDKTRVQLGQNLAALHQISGSTAFGWHQDNTIGTTTQPNPWTQSWVAFWQTSRIGHQLELAYQKGARFIYGDRLLEAIPDLLKGHLPKPSLVHGDLWGGNASALATGEPVIYDPSVYWGDREVDLAMTELFGGFGTAFYQGYQAIYPIDPGFTKRKILYNLYHILNHYNLFGGGYMGQADRMMAALLN
jgi:fructosamine-3-kinase